MTKLRKSDLCETGTNGSWTRRPSTRPVDHPYMRKSFVFDNRKNANSGKTLPLLTPFELEKLIEKRNEQDCKDH